MKTNYSHAFLVGVFTKPPSISNLDENVWIHSILSPNEYHRDSSIYYKSHLDAVVEHDSKGSKKQKRPKFLRCVKHYYHDISEDKQKILLSGTVTTQS